MASIKYRTRKARQTVLRLKEIWRTSWLHLSGWTMDVPSSAIYVNVVEQCHCGWTSRVLSSSPWHSCCTQSESCSSGWGTVSSFLPVSPGGYVFVLWWQCLFAQLVASCRLFPSVHADHATDPDLHGPNSTGSLLWNGCPNAWSYEQNLIVVWCHLVYDTHCTHSTIQAYWQMNLVSPPPHPPWDKLEDFAILVEWQGIIWKSLQG